MKKISLIIIIVLVFALSLFCFRVSAAEWTAMDSSTDRALIGVWGSSKTDVFAVGTGETIVHFDGTSWTNHYPESSPNHYANVWGSSGTDVFAVGGGGKIIHYDGSSWSEMNSGTTADLKGVWGTSPNNVFVVGYGFHIILHYDGNLGGNWTFMNTGPTDRNLYDIWGSSATDVYAVSTGGIIIHYDGNLDGIWTLIDTGIRTELKGIGGTSADNIFAVGTNGFIIHFDGTSWTAMESGTTELLYDVWCRSETECFATGFNGVILYYNGHTWSPEESGTTDRLYGVWGSAEGDIFAVGYNGTILTTSVLLLPTYSCTGFEAPCDGADVALSVKKNKCIPLKTELLDKNGFPITDADIEYPPVLVLVNFEPAVIPPDIVAIDGLPQSQATDGNQFEFIGGRWCFNLKVKDYYTAPGIYTFEMMTGNQGEYIINSTCRVAIAVEK